MQKELGRIEYITSCHKTKLSLRGIVLSECEKGMWIRSCESCSKQKRCFGFPPKRPRLGAEWFCIVVNLSQVVAVLKMPVGTVKADRRLTDSNFTRAMACHAILSEDLGIRRVGSSDISPACPDHRGAGGRLLPAAIFPV